MPGLTQAIDKDEYEAELLARALFAEDAGGGPEIWKAVSDSMFNSLDSKRFKSNNLEGILGERLTSVRSNSRQYQLASDPSRRNAFEDKVFDDILQFSRNEVKQRRAGKWQSSIGKATHFEHIQRYGIPNWVEASPDAKATRTFPQRHGLTFWEGIR